MNFFMKKQLTRETAFNLGQLANTVRPHPAKHINGNVARLAGLANILSLVASALQPPAMTMFLFVRAKCLLINKNYILPKLEVMVPME